MSLLDRVFDRSGRSAAEAVLTKLVAYLSALETEKRQREKITDKTNEGCTKYLAQLKIHCFGNEDTEVTKEGVLALAVEGCRTDILSLLVRNLPVLDFEARKDVGAVFGALVRVREGETDSGPGAVYVLQHPELLELLKCRCDEPSVALVCGAMLRDCTRDEAIARTVLYSPMFMEFFDKVQVANFEIASDAFSTFKDLLTRHKATVAAFLQEQYTPFFAAYMKLLQSSNYVTKRQSLKLLGELLLDRSSVKVMVKFVGEVPHLVTMMMLLKDQSRSIQFEAFHVFKVFVANPNKPTPIVEILAGNRDKLLKYLEEFHTDKDEDEQFKEEKAVLIREISSLSPPAPAEPAPAPAPDGS
ncbi:hypothetical protein FOA52_013921 [Chlamydomonas sp. UWO 241]|nr:hypothetical protein FOA52_013921 [Chlamydomonas sp. UWO 241]